MTGKCLPSQPPLCLCVYLFKACLAVCPVHLLSLVCRPHLVSPAYGVGRTRGLYVAPRCLFRCAFCLTASHGTCSFVTRPLPKHNTTSIHTVSKCLWCSTRCLAGCLRRAQGNSASHNHLMPANSPTSNPSCPTVLGAMPAKLIWHGHPSIISMSAMPMLRTHMPW